MPSLTTCMKWLRERADFADQYARAREEQADGYADELIELAHQANETNAQAIRVRADILKWVCSKLKPKRYGERLDVSGEVTSVHKLTLGDPDARLLEVARTIGAVLAAADRIKSLPAPQIIDADPVPVLPESVTPGTQHNDSVG